MRRNSLAGLLAVLLMSGLLALPAAAQDRSPGGAGKSPCDQQSMHHKSGDRSQQTITPSERDRYGYHQGDDFRQYGHDEYGYGYDDYGYDTGYYDDYGYYHEEPGQGYGEDYGWYGDEGYGSEYDYPPLDPDEFVFESGYYGEDEQDEPRPYRYQSTGWQFGRNIEAQVVGFEHSRTPIGKQDVELRVMTPDGEQRVLYLGDPDFVQANLPEIREGDIVVVQGNMVEIDREPHFQAMQIIAEDGSVFRLQDSGFATGTEQPMDLGYRYGVEADLHRPEPIERDYVWVQEAPAPYATAESWRVHGDFDRRKDYSRRGEASKEDLDRAARFGYKNARNVEATYAKHDISGRIVSLQTIDADEFGGEVVVGRVLTDDGQQVDVVLGAPHRIGDVRPGSNVRVVGTTRLFDGSDTLIAQDVTVRGVRDRSWSGGSDVARRVR